MVYAIILAAGVGSRMQSKVKKQYMEIGGVPVIVHTLKKFEQSKVDKIILVTGKEDIDYCQYLIRVNKISKVETVIEGGKERYDSVYNGLLYIENTKNKTEDKSNTQENDNVVLIHDGARPLVSSTVINKCIKEIEDKDALVVAVPVKETIKISDGHNNVTETPDRSKLWSIQTPQTFKYNVIKKSYDEMYKKIDVCKIKPTDDSMVVEEYSDCIVRIIEGDYTNIKITTPEDIDVAQRFLKII